MDIMNYKKYGYFKNAGTDKYSYVVKDQEGLSEAAGEGVYPNTSGVNWDPRYKKAKDEGRLEGSHWDFVNTGDLEANFYKWANAPEPQGVRMFYIGLSLEKSGLLKHAIKAYYSIVVYFPKSMGWTYFRTPWYISQVAIDRIDFLLRNHPELNMELRGARIKVENGFDGNIANDKFIVNPGELRRLGFFDNIKKILFKGKDARTGKVVKQIGDGKDSLEKLSTDEVKLSVIHSQVGDINESDVMLASASNAIIIGFHVNATNEAKALAKQEEVEIRIYSIIYEIVNEIQAAMEGMLEPVIEETFLGRAEVRQVFNVSKAGVVAGCFISKGRIPRDAVCKLIREKEIIFKGKMSSLKHFKDDLKEAKEGFECGISLGFKDIQKGDLIEAIEIRKVARRLK